MIVLGIDPSFTGTGVCLFDTHVNLVLASTKIKAPFGVYDGIDKVHQNCDYIIRQLDNFIWSTDNVRPRFIAIEYPALQTKSGAYLAILNGALATHFIYDRVVWFPPNAVDAWTKNKEHSKSYLVDFCYKNKLTIKERTSHDICTAIILVKMCEAVFKGTYKNKWFANFDLSVTDKLN